MPTNAASSAGGRLASLVAEAEASADGRAWYARAPLLAYFAWVLVRQTSDPMYGSIFEGLNLVLHEIGHVVFGPFGQVAMVAGGSLFQCLCPLLAALVFYRQRDFFAIAICSCWLSTNLFGVARYVADARALSLPLVSLGSGEPIHDWNFLLERAGLLSHDLQIARVFSLASILAMAAGLVGGGWLCWRMAVNRGRGTDD